MPHHKGESRYPWRDFIVQCEKSDYGQVDDLTNPDRLKLCEGMALFKHIPSDGYTSESLKQLLAKAAIPRYIVGYNPPHLLGDTEDYQEKE